MKMIWSALQVFTHPSDMEMTVLKCQLYNKAADRNGETQDSWLSSYLRDAATIPAGLLYENIIDNYLCVKGIIIDDQNLHI